MDPALHLCIWHTGINCHSRSVGEMYEKRAYCQDSRRDGVSGDGCGVERLQQLPAGLVGSRSAGTITKYSPSLPGGRVSMAELSY